MGPQIVFYFVLWVANHQRLRTTDLNHTKKSLSSKLNNTNHLLNSGEIVGLLSANRRVGADLIADVIDQSADNLVDGVTAGTKQPLISSV